MRHASIMGMAAAAVMAGMGQSAEVLPRDDYPADPLRDALRLAGRAFSRDQTPGAFGRPRYKDGGHNPAGTKLVRRFIRHSGRESVYWRELYKQMTGDSYG